MTDVLQVIGFGATARAAYVALLDAGPMSVDVLATRSGLTRHQVERALGELRGAGLVSQTPTRPHRYAALPPRAALDVHLLKRQADLQQAQMALAELEDRFRTSRARHARPVDIVEVVDGRDAIALRLMQLISGAKREVLMTDKPPYAVRIENEADYEGPVLERGVQWRGVYHAPGLTLPGRLEAITRLVARGEQARVLDDVRVKVAIFDREVAIVPLHPSDGVSYPEGGVIVQQSPLLDSLVDYFEGLWNRAQPLSPTTDAADMGLTEMERKILSLLTAGAKDEAIAVALNIGDRTVGRCIARLMQRLGARTRFDLGRRATVAGWLDDTRSR